MALVFTDKQIKELTGQILAGPAKKKVAEENKAKAVQTKQDFLILDEQNEVFTNHYQLSVINKYHDELKYIIGETRTNYDLANIDPAGQLADGNVHFPLQNPQWPEYEPMIIDSNNGNPRNLTGFADHEGKWIADLLQYIDELLNGWTDGNATTTSELPGLVGGVLTVDDPAGFSVGDRLLAYTGSIGSYMVIDNIVGTPADPGPPPVPATNGFEVTVLAGATSFGAGATVQNFFTGFTNSQRETGLGIPTYLNFLFTYFKGLVDQGVEDWNTESLSFQQTALDANDATEDKATLDGAKQNLEELLQTIDDWETAPEFGVNQSRFGDSLINPFVTSINDRDAYRPARQTEISDALGTVSQDPNGISGQGQYFNFFRALDQRVNKQSGSLRQFYGSQGVEKNADVQIRAIENQNGMTDGSFIINLFAQNADNSSKVKLKTLRNVSVGEILKIMGNEGQVLDVEVLDIDELESTVTFNTPIPEFYTQAIQARAVKVL